MVKIRKIIKYYHENKSKRWIAETLNVSRDVVSGYNYSQFCHHYHSWRIIENSVSMHIEHKSGDKMFVDFTGKKMEIIDKDTGEIKKVEIFVAILGASGLTYVEAVESQKKHDFIKANENALYYFGGVPMAIVPDCLKSAVTKADRYEPEINQEYEDFANYYGTIILPARSRKPKDKALVENAVKIVYSRIFAPLRNEKKTFLKKKVMFNYHIEIREDRHYYSVPYRYCKQEVKVIYTDNVVEIYDKNSNRIAIHKRSRESNKYTTIPEHMPSKHRFVSEWNAERFVNWAESLGDNIKSVIENILAKKRHPEQGYRVCIGILSLSKKYEKDELDKVCRKALCYNYYSLKWITNCLKNNNYKTLDELSVSKVLPDHENIRGQNYYTAGGIKNEYFINN